MWITYCMVEEIKEMEEAGKMENPGWKECPPYLYAGGGYRPVYSATEDEWELVLGNMTKEEQEASTGEKGTDSEEESMRGDGRCAESLRSRKEAGKEAKERGKKESKSKNEKKNSRWSNLQTEAKEIKEEDDTQIQESQKRQRKKGNRRTLRRQTRMEL